MPSEVDTLKTNEFLRRRKLRLQQVREQSKDIAKKIRQRAKVENLRQVIELDSKKKKEYLQRQEQLVNKLEEYYAAALDNVGSSHKNASEVRLQGADGVKVDPSKQRGREAAAQLRKKRQHILDKQKELLDRKLQAREVANEISRDKSGAALNKLLEETKSKSSVIESDNVHNAKKHIHIAQSDMATQWDLDEIPNEWEPNIPTLLLPKDDNSVKESNNNNVDSKSDKSKRLDLFAVSEEMPPSLCGGLTNHEERVPLKSSLTLISEYLQNRNLRLRETDTNRTNKKLEDIQSLKQTIFHTRTSKEGTVDACHVHDGEMVPVPSWQAETVNCGFCYHKVGLHKNYDKSSKTPIKDLNTHFSSFRPRSTFQNLPKTSNSLKSYNMHGIKPHAHPDVFPSPVLRGTSPFRRAKMSSRSFSAKGEAIEKQFKSSKCAEDCVVPKKSLVTMYNHVTRDSRDIPFSDESLVVRNSQDADDAYSQAMKETSPSQVEHKDHHKKVQEIRSKVAMTKQNVEKEYRDTISFLNALPKDKGNKPIKTAYMDEQRQQMQKDMRQQKLQQEYRKIEKECSKHTCKNKPQSKSHSPVKSNSEFENTDMQYSWMPVPEGDGNLAIHTIPTTLREGKSNTVKFSKIDSYHEYRSRHKHTPPTKETADNPNNINIPDSFDAQNSSDAESESTSSSSSLQSVRLVKRDKPMANKELSDAERIIIYKILDTKDEERKSTSKLMKNIAKSLTRIEQNTKTDSKQKKSDAIKSNDDVDNLVSFEQINEGVYKAANENGDNIASMYFHDKDAQEAEGNNGLKRCKDCKKHTKQPHKVAAPQQWQAGDKIQERSRSPRTTVCHCNCKNVTPNGKSLPVSQQSMSTSASSFLTAANDKINATSDGGFVKLVDDGGREAGKFYIGASGLLKNDAYEVVIQVRKKGDEKESTIKKSEDDKKDKALSVDRVTVVSTTQTSLRDIYEGSENKTETVAASNIAEAQDNNTPETERDSYRSEVSTDTSSRRMMASDVIPRSKENVPAESNVFEKGEPSVSENIKAQTVPKASPAAAPRPATSTSTQTNLNSPSHRPVLFHMSSSTSTAYMSPPEMILPKFMRPGYCITDEEIYDPKNYAVEQIITEQHEYSAKLDCDCRKCMHARRLTLANQVSAPKPPRHRCKSARNPRTPPNTAGSARSEFLDKIYFNDDCKNVAPHVHVDFAKQSKCACRKCTRYKHEHNSLCHKKSRQSMPSKLSSRKIPSSMSSKKGAMTSRNSKTSLKPIVKDYVDKLLELNKESLKAVQIVDQDCSSITTPGSSVINIPNNIDRHKPSFVENKLSLEKIRDILKQKIIDECEKKVHKTESGNNQNAQMCYRVQNTKKLHKMPRKKTAHKVKSLNISKKMSKVKPSSDSQTNKYNSVYSSSSAQERSVKKQMSSASSRSNVRSKRSPTHRLPSNSDTTDRSGNSDLPHSNFNIPKFSKCESKNMNVNELKTANVTLQISGSSNHAMTTASNDSDRNAPSLKNNPEINMSISTQTSINIDSEVNYMKLAEDKLQNMEKIADLTEKCTKRLSNLAKVLEEVRKNKTLVYSHISTSDATSDSDQKSDKNVINTPPPQESSNDASKKPEQSSHDLTKKATSNEDDNSLNSTDYVPFLSNIPKPVAFKSVNSDLGMNLSSISLRKSNSSPDQDNVDQPNKLRGKPPPALSRLHLKHGDNFVVPHELSTVVEVDSPMSIKLKSSRNETKADAPETSNNRSNELINDLYHTYVELSELKMGDANNPDLLDNNDASNEQHKDAKAMWSDNINSKAQMIDIEQFNEIMLKPFFSLQEYAKQCNVRVLDDGSNLDDVLKDDRINDELSSLHSEASLPDVISELLKRNVISEPFKFDSGSNVSSESSISVLALSRAKKETNRSNLFKNKDNIGETSDTMSCSSNPDLENAFKKLGMGWASSTLKKTKERLALSSSSNTSSSSLSQFRIKGFNQDLEPATDTVSSLLSLPNKLQPRNTTDISKNAEQQTSKTNAMTVKEFLTNKLAKKITFNNKSKNDTADEYVSLYETKMPEEMNHSSQMVREEGHSIDNSLYSGSNNRARTSTPVQLYKSMTYHSTSSSNMSNGLFSNADDLSSVKVTSNSMKHSTSDKDDLIIPNFSLRKKGSSDCSKSD